MSDITMRNSTNPLYYTWISAKGRVTNPNNKAWKWYGGRGLTMCEHWLTDFNRFVADMGPRPQGTSIDRRNNNMGYLCPLCYLPKGNCHWASRKEQAGNTQHVERKALLLSSGNPNVECAPAASSARIPAYNWRAHWLTAQEFARMMGRRPQTVYKWIRLGTLPEFGIPTFEIRSGGLHSGRVFIQNIF